MNGVGQALVAEGTEAVWLGGERPSQSSRATTGPSPAGWRLFVSMATASVMATGSAGCGPGPSARRPFRLELREIASYSVPDSFRMTGATIGHSGAIAAWSARPPTLWIRRPHGPPHFERLGFTPLSMAFVRGDTLLEAVDAHTGRIIGYRVSSGPAWEVSIPTPRHITAATRTNGAWFLGAPVGDSLYEIYRRTRHAGSKLIARIISGLQDARDDALSFQLSATRSGLLVTELAPPFKIRHLASDGHTLKMFGPDLPHNSHEGGAGGGAGQPYAWVSLPTVSLGPAGFLQTLTNLRGEQRCVLHYDTTGVLLKRTEVNVPLGFVSSLSDKYRLLAVRHTDLVELVLYDWSWRQSAPRSRETDTQPKRSSPCSG